MNTQPIEKQITSAHSLDVQGEPWLTIQGEGIFAGRRAVFVRLAGCQYLCPACDSDYTSNRNHWEYDALVERIGRFKEELVVITGGEPFRQPLRTLTDLLLHKAHIVQIETNGGLFQELSYLHGGLHIVCSPKSRHVDERLLPYISAWKYVVQHGHVNDRGLPHDTLGRTDPVFQAPENHPAPIYVQPLDEGDPEKNALNIQIAVQSVLNHGHQLCLQIHKIAGLP